MEILFRELLRLLGALIDALLIQSWQPLEGMLSETGGGGGLGLALWVGGGALLLLLFLAGVAGLAWIFRRRIFPAENAPHSGTSPAPSPTPGLAKTNSANSK